MVDMRIFSALRLLAMFLLALGMASIPVVATLTLGNPVSVSAATIGTPEVLVVNGDWVVSTPRSLAKLKENAPTMKIEGVGRYRTYSGKDSCNSYIGRVRVVGHNVRFLTPMQTKMACQGETASTDALYHKLLQKSTRLERVGQSIKLYSGDGKLLLTFVPAPAPVTR